MAKRKTGPIVVRCCVCGRERIGSRWVKPAKPEPPNVRVSHSYCPKCFKSARRRLKKSTPRRR